MGQEALFSLREGDSAGGYWGQIHFTSNPDSVVATLYHPAYAQDILTFLNDRSPHSSDCACDICALERQATSQ